MKIAVFGGTGKTGKPFVEQALEAGHSIRMLARNPVKVDIKHESLEVVQGDVCVLEDVRKVLHDQEAVCCAIGGNGLGDSTTRTKGTKNIVAAMKEYAVRPLVICSALGQGKSKKHLSLVGKMVLHSILKNPMSDHADQEAVVLNSGLDWVIVRPPRLTDGPKTEKYRWAAEEDSFGGSRISRADVAHFMLRSLQEEGWYQKAISISS